MTKLQGEVILVVNLVTILVLLILCILSILPRANMKFIDSIPAARILDWEVRPYVKIEVHEEDCPSGTYDIFDRTWQGTEVGCYNFLGDGVFRSNSCDEFHETVAPIEPIVMSTIEGKHICGTHGGKSFLTVNRPDYESGQCPTWTARCSNQTSIENTVCYFEHQLESSCPIIDIRFVEAEDISAYSNYKAEELNPINATHSRWLLYTTTSNSTDSLFADSLPITSFTIDRYNCIKPYQNQTSQATNLYPLEVERLLPRECEASAMMDEVYDSRSIEQLNITMNNLRADSGVNDVLTTLQGYSEDEDDENK